MPRGADFPEKSAGPTFHPRKMKSGSAWYVLVAWPGRHTERIKGFPSEVTAKDWVAKESLTWLKKQRYMLANRRK
jgi:hypothetical protein